MRFFQNFSLLPILSLDKSKQIAVLGISSLALLSGCQASKGLFHKVDNGSLAYQNSKYLEPLQLPAHQETAPFQPLYQISPASPNTLNLQNNTGTRYQLPPPYRQKMAE